MPKPWSMIAAGLLISAGAGAAEIKLENPGFEADANARGRIPGWVLTQHTGPRAYELKIDETSATEGKRSIRLKRTTEQIYGMLAQQVPGKEYIGQTVEATASIKTEDVGHEGWVMVLSFRVMGDVMWQERTAPLTGTQGWQRVTLRGKVPPRTTTIEVGFLLLDGGTGWADGVTLATVDKAGGGDKPAAKNGSKPAKPADKPVAAPKKAAPKKAAPKKDGAA